jgi:endonuclease-3
MEELTALPGIGRKSANVILGNAFGVPGFAVDTHVIRLSNRIGFAATKDPVKIEEAVTGALPDKYWTEFSHLLIKHGRTRCPARKPDCPACEIRGLCDYPAKG